MENDHSSDNGELPPPRAPLPECVVQPDADAHGTAIQRGRSMALGAIGKDRPPIPDDAGLHALSNDEIVTLAEGRGVLAPTRDANIAGLQKHRDETALGETNLLDEGDAAEAHGTHDLKLPNYDDVIIPLSPTVGEIEAISRDPWDPDELETISRARARDLHLAVGADVFDPTNPREFDPTVVLLQLERDGVVVAGYIDPFTGEGTHDLLVKLQDQLVIARSREDGAAPPPTPDLRVEQPDPNALRRQRAAAAGHDLPGDGARCVNCDIAEWAALDGEPCTPKVTTDLAVEEDHH